MGSQDLFKVDPKFFEKKRIKSFDFNNNKRASRFKPNQAAFLNQFQVNYNLEGAKPRGALGLGGNVQIAHQNFGSNSNNNNPVSISAVNINIFQKDQQFEQVEENKIMPEYSNMPSHSKLNPSTLSKTDPFSRMTSTNQLPGDKNLQEECSLHHFKDNLFMPNDQFSGKNFFGIDNLSINNKPRSNMNSISYGNFHKR